VLVEQLLPAGGHCERSAMYHVILLAGLLDLAAARRAARLPEAPIVQAIGRMIAWLVTVVGPGGRLPQLNDAAPGPAPGTQSVLRAAGELGFASNAMPVRPVALVQLCWMTQMRSHWGASQCY